MLQQTFIQLLENYTNNPELMEKFWNEVQLHYSEKGRYYHTLTHLRNLLSVLKEVQTKIQDWDVVLFALYYHDIIYNPTNNKNEEKSAELAKIRLSEISFPVLRINKCYSMILATKTHSVSDDSDTNYFTDADLSILGQNFDTYFDYTQQLRKEYAIYPDFLYKPGRKKAVHHFLQMNRVFKTEYFFGKFEKQARENLRFEIQSL